MNEMISGISEVEVCLDIKNVVRRQGIREYANTRAEIKKVIADMIRLVEDNHLVRGRFVYQLHPVQSLDRQTISVKEGVVLHGVALAPLESASELAVIVCTIGDRLEHMASDYFAAKEPLKGLLLDGIASAAVDYVSQQACGAISKYASSRGSCSSSPVSPGMPGMDIRELASLFKLVDAGKIGVTLTTSGIMLPRKSLAMISGIGKGMFNLTQAEVCRRCPISRTCPHRVMEKSRKRGNNGQS
jgi:cobalamin-dependent methionine synthase I